MATFRHGCGGTSTVLLGGYFWFVLSAAIAEVSATDFGFTVARAKEVLKLVSLTATSPSWL